MGLWRSDNHHYHFDLDRDNMRRLVTLVINEWEMKGEGWRSRMAAVAVERGQLIAKLQRTIARQRRQGKKLRAALLELRKSSDAVARAGGDSTSGPRAGESSPVVPPPPTEGSPDQ